MKIRTSNIAVIAVAAMLLATAAISTSALPNSAFAYKKNQATSQANACGNDFVPINVGCQNTGSQTQGDENSVALAAQQTFPAVDFEKKVKPKPPEPPAARECSEVAPNYAWDITIQALHDPPNDDVPVGTIVCIFQGLGNHEATVIEPEAGGAMEVYNAMVNTNQPNEDPQCNGNDQQLAEVTSDNGGLPQNVELGDMLCATVGPPIVM